MQNTSLSNLGLQSVTLTPQFIFGVNGAIKNNLHVVDEKKLLYVAGHNVIIYNMDERSQHFIPGTEGTEGINAIAVSQCSSYLAVCEKGFQKAQCMIYEIKSHKLEKTIPEMESHGGQGSGEVEYKCKQFLDVAFDPKQKCNRLITLCGEPDWFLLLWRWDEQKVMAKVDLCLQDPTREGVWELSWQNINTAQMICVTGPGCYRYYQLSEDMQNCEFECQHTSILAHGLNFQLSDDYAGHTWIVDEARIIVYTTRGEMILIDYEGKFLAYINDSPGKQIHCCLVATDGLVLAGENGHIWTYQPTNLADVFFYRTNSIGDSSQNAQHTPGDAISSMTLSPDENVLFVVTKNNQMEKMAITFQNLAQVQSNKEQTTSANQVDLTPFKRSPVHTEFHQGPITGMDVCLRKQLIVTTSQRYICIWNYAEKTLEQKCPCQAGDDAYAVAFHPSGFQIVVAFNDKIQLMNILSNCIKDYHSILVKNCRELKFAAGGHMFAAAIFPNNVNIYYFYTYENPSYYQCKGHQQKVLGIDWYEDDMGFTSCALDGNVFFYDLQLQKEMNTRNNAHDKKSNTLAGFRDVANIPGCPYDALVVGGSNNIYEKRGDSFVPINAGVTISQIKILNNNKAIFAGSGDEHRPGAIQIWKFPLEKLNEVQAHGPGGIERMRLSHDNQFLFTAGHDGTLMILNVKDKDPRGGMTRQRETGAPIPFSKEILTEKSEVTDLESFKAGLLAELDTHKNPGHSGVDEKMGAAPQEERIKELQDQLASTEVQARNAHDHLNNSKLEMEETFEKQIEQLEQEQHEQLEARRNEYSQKMLEDAARYNDLSLQKEEEQRKFTKSQADLLAEHQAQVDAEQRIHNEDVATMKTRISTLQEKTRENKQKNEETVNQITMDAEQEVEDIEKKNKQNMTQVQEMGLKSKAELQLTKNKLTDVEAEIDQLTRQIQDKKMQLQTQSVIIDELNQKNKNQQQQIVYKDKAIGERERKIYDLKKKTQELEKFKFVLDYKIKELKRDIAPRQMEINKLQTDTNEMDQRLKAFNKVNANLGYLVDDLRTRQEQMQELIKKSRSSICRNERDIEDFKTAVYNVSRHIDDYEMLKHCVQDQLLGFVQDQAQKDTEVDPHIKKETENQTAYLESSVTQLKKRLEQESIIHKKEHLRIMEQNMGLIEQSVHLRQTVNKLNSQLKSNKPVNYDEEEELLQNESDYPAQNNFMNENENMPGQQNNMAGMTDDDQKIVQLKRQIDVVQGNNEEMRRIMHEKTVEAAQMRAELAQFVVKNLEQDEENSQQNQQIMPQPNGQQMVDPNGQIVDPDSVAEVM